MHHLMQIGPYLWCVGLAAAGEGGKAKQSAEPTEQGRGQVSAASRSTRRSASGQPHGRGSEWWSAALTVQDAGVEGLQGFCDDLQAVRDRVLRQKLTWLTAVKVAPESQAIAGLVLRCNCLAQCACNSATGCRF